MWPFRSRPRASQGPEAAEAERPSGAAEDASHPRHARWDFEERTEIAPGRFTLKRLGGGGANEVYLVWDERLFSLAVAKLLRPDRVEDEHARRELKREADLLDRLAHPALVRGFDAVLEGPRPHLLLEHAEGPTLRRLIDKERALAVEQLVPLALHLASVLQYLASHRVVHLDVKPGNVVVGIPPTLIDLSIARTFESAARLKAPIGTDAYMAPEQCDPAASASPVGPASDVWGLGATLYHAAAGRRPFEPTASARFPQLTQDPAPLPRQVPAPFAEVVLQMLRKDPAGRPALVDVVAALEPLVPERPQRRAIR